MIATVIASHFQVTTDCGARALSMMLLVMKMMMIFPTLGFPFLIGLRLPTAGQTATRLTSTMAWFLRPLSNVPI